MSNDLWSTRRPPEGYRKVCAYSPPICSPPWDVRLRDYVVHMKDALTKYGIPEDRTFVKFIASPPIIGCLGTGPGGRERFGDNMRPDCVEVYVDPKFFPRAKAIYAKMEGNPYARI